MKLEDCKIGMTVLATHKSYITYKSMGEFLKQYPLGTTKIESISNDLVLIGIKSKIRFLFYPEELILIDKPKDKEGQNGTRK